MNSFPSPNGPPLGPSRDIYIRSVFRIRPIIIRMPYFSFISPLFILNPSFPLFTYSFMLRLSYYVIS